MPRSISVALVLSVITNFALAQADFRKGYIVNNAGDTLTGFIDYRENAKAFQSCDFKDSKSQIITAYSPKEIKGYGFLHDKIFESRKIAISETPVFLEALVKGPANLYTFKGTFWLEKGGSDLQQLTNEARETYVDGQKILKNSNQYIATINMLLNDCPDLRSSIQNVSLRERSLTNLIEKYNKCKGATIVAFKSEKPWAVLKAGITGGLNISHLSFQEKYSKWEYLHGSFEQSTVPLFGISLNLISPRISERFSLQTDALYSSPKYIHDTFYDRSTNTQENHVVIELQQLKVPISIRYTLAEKDVTPYFNFGISNTFHLSSSSTLESKTVVKQTNQTFSSKGEAFLMKKTQFGFWAGIGLQKSLGSKLAGFFELRYEQTNGIVSIQQQQNYLKSKITNFQLSIGIRMK
jgi:hypothetical protein